MPELQRLGCRSGLHELGVRSSLRRPNVHFLKDLLSLIYLSPAALARVALTRPGELIAAFVSWEICFLVGLGVVRSGV